jgi:hypothetical protein
MEGKKLAKSIVRAISAAGIHVVVHNIVIDTMPDKQSVFRKILTGIGEVVITGILAESVARFAEHEVEETVAVYQEVQAFYKDKKK